MKRTIYLPDDLATQLNQYLEEHPGETLSSLVQDALELKFAPKNISRLLDLAGIVDDAPCHAGDRAEDHLD